MTKDEALRLALEVLADLGMKHYENTGEVLYKNTYTAIKAALEAKDEPVAWLLTDKNINSLQVDSIQRLIDRLKHAHHTDLCVRINGQDEWFQADWLKHMVRASPPQRKPLTNEEIQQIFIANSVVVDNGNAYMVAGLRTVNIARAIEAKLKEKNT